MITRGIKFHHVRVGGAQLLMGNMPACVGNIGHRRRGSDLKRARAHRVVVGSLQLVGRLGVGTIHADRCPGRPLFCRLYSRCNVCMISRTGVRARKVNSIPCFGSAVPRPTCHPR